MLLSSGTTDCGLQACIQIVISGHVSGTALHPADAAGFQVVICKDINGATGCSAVVRTHAGSSLWAGPLPGGQRTDMQDALHGHWGSSAKSKLSPGSNSRSGTSNMDIVRALGCSPSETSSWPAGGAAAGAAVVNSPLPGTCPSYAGLCAGTRCPGAACVCSWGQPGSAVRFGYAGYKV